MNKHDCGLPTARIQYRAGAKVRTDIVWSTLEIKICTMVSYHHKSATMNFMTIFLFIFFSIHSFIQSIPKSFQKQNPVDSVMQKLNWFLYNTTQEFWEDYKARIQKWPNMAGIVLFTIAHNHLISAETERCCYASLHFSIYRISILAQRFIPV